MLTGKTVIIGVTGSIAAYKAANLASMLVKLHACVHVIMTKNAANFIHPITFESLTKNKCLVDTFDRNFQFHVAHVSLAQQADILIVAPASANTIAKLAYGIADDMLSTTTLAAKCKKIIVPAMNTNMYENPIVQDNIEKLKSYGMIVVEPESGRLACGDIGKGKMPKEERLVDYIVKEIAMEKTFLHKKIIVTAGATREAIDPVRFISNHSSGKMGYAIARQASLKGADVVLIHGQTALDEVPFVKMIPVTTAKEMFEAVKKESQDADIIIKAAAVADYRPKQAADQKIKKSDASYSILLERTDDILKFLGEHKKEGQFICGFAMETEKLLEHAREKLVKKKIDMIVANSLNEKGAGFGVDTNRVTILTREDEYPLELMSKEETAKTILTYINHAIVMKK